MLDGTDVPVIKRYVVEGQNYYYHNQQHPGSPIKDSVQVYYQFKNEEKAASAADAGGRAARLSAGLEGRRAVRRRRPHHAHAEGRDAERQDRQRFDVICERKQTDFEKIAANVYEFEYEITLRNHKASAISVEVNER
jgi:hypothetical protein